jgi:ABC-type multidrug transport system ATPase subunit
MVHDVSLDVRPGEVVGLIGSAGTGKSTLLALAAGWVRPVAGDVTVAGLDAGAWATRRLVGYAPADPAFPPGLTVRGLLEYFAWFHGPARSRPALVAQALELAELAAVPDERPAGLPQGLRRRVSLAQAVLGGRRVLLLDETFAGTDVTTRRAICERLGRLAWHGAAIVLASHDLATVERFADRVVVLRAGRVARDQAAALLLRERVLEVVLDVPPAAAPPGFRVAPFGVEAELAGRTIESALAVCRAHRLVVRATRVRTRSLEDVVVESGGGP